MTSYTPIHLTTGPHWRDLPIREDCSPQRASLTVNCLIPIARGKSKYLLCHNFDPVNWKQWYPPFSFFHADVTGRYRTAGDLVDYIESHSSLAKSFDSREMRATLIKVVQDLLAVSDVHLREEPIQSKDYWLKFSESKKTWTVYCFVSYLMIDATPKDNLIAVDNERLALVPVGVSEYNGLRVVENLVALLDLPFVRSTIENEAILVGRQE